MSAEDSPHVCKMFRPIVRNGTYQNPWPCDHRLPSFWDLLKWWCLRKNVACHCTVKHSAGPQLIPDFQLAKQKALSDGLSACWLGHSTLMVSIGRTAFITDPVLSPRCSPVPCLGPKRIGPLPCSPDELPDELEGVLISHNHYDHLDLATVRCLNEKYGRRLTWFVPSGLRWWFASVGCASVEEMSWQEEVVHRSNSGEDVRIVCLPAQHWSMRSGFDRNKSLWCSWAIVGAEKRFFFAGDTGYCPAFKAIGDLYGPFDLAAIPIGCYEPRWFMRYQHVDPEEAVRIHNDLQSRASIGIHWGTYDMGALEHYLEPPCKLDAECKRQGVPENTFCTLRIGEVWSSA